jgi:DNA-binding response OmpR family regulator
MRQPLNILLVEDNPHDAELLVRELRRADFEPRWERVDTEAEYLAKLRPSLDLILSDFAMPQFDGMRALELLNRSALQIPFIIVSGTIGEDTAVSAMKQGAMDYLLKDRLARLGPAVYHARERSRLARERQEADRAFRAQAVFFTDVLNSLTASMVVVNESGVITAVNESWARFAKTNDGSESVGQNYLEVCHRSALSADSADARAALIGIREILQGRTEEFVLEYPCHSPTEQRWFAMRVSALTGAERGAVIAHENITARWLAELKIREQLNELLRWQEVMLNREDRVLALKTEVNELLARSGQRPRYVGGEV